ncbi:chloride channel protein [Turicibacter sanguinis]|uniref:chloride channel protein n=1 Tax=Turicibacter sanguinis TaxID=154288 RepID=UPI0012BBF66E|nr:chloride channel protein [Turicibacter sanguinis]MDB8438946.1 chloride channel protein [Turicibacter sanguinis]MTO24661.1 voltage-gated chloride channel [Turicibacter sanguinis]MTO27726.1 voltage-gated chloride channel [Turicibacter sanguinis]MTO90658.1 voltage-gated chloride channel [Turicibacter sanguinis]MTP70746.1 voltage-gated chloride channel [Turicibacter sanguinis]
MDSFKKLVLQLVKWILLSLLMGVMIGVMVGGFKQILSTANHYRSTHEKLVFGLPVAGVVISFLYVKVRRNAYSGENLLKSEVQQAAKNIPLSMIPAVVIGSLVTTFFGGSAGKEAAGVAIGGITGDFLSRKFHLSDEEQRTLVVAGVGSGFGVLYNTPLAGAILGMELVLKGKFHYEALLPAFLTSVISSEVAKQIGDELITYPSLELGALDLTLILKLVGMGLLFGLVAMMFNGALDLAPKIYSRWIKSPYIKGMVGGVLTIILFWMAGDNYNGLGQSHIALAFEEPVSLIEFIWKIIFTAVALGSVFQGGRGNPTFFVGATFGSAIATFFKLPVASVAALGMIGVFCGATALPLTGIMMAIEYFGSSHVMAIIIVMIISYSISGFYDLLTHSKLAKGKKEIFEGQVESNGN